jgi:hypothetical protein
VPGVRGTSPLLCHLDILSGSCSYPGAMPLHQRFLNLSLKSGNSFFFFFTISLRDISKLQHKIHVEIHSYVL